MPVARFEPTETSSVNISNVRGAVIQKGVGTVTILENDPEPSTWPGLSASATIAKTEEQRWQTPELASGDYGFDLTQIDGDADLYVRINAPPTTFTFDCRPAKPRLNESCAVRLATPAVTHVMVRGYETKSSFLLKGAAR